MNIFDWRKKIVFWESLLFHVEFSDFRRRRLACDEGFEKLRHLVISMRDHNNTLYAIGNGASASIASHFSADLAKNGQLHTQVFFDLSLMTAISNDIGFDEVFAEPLRRRAETGDAIVAISSSGNSANILRAVEVARDKGVFCITVTAMSEDNLLRTLGDLNIYVPAQSYGDAETCHTAILHYWIDLVLNSHMEGEEVTSLNVYEDNGEKA